MHFNHYQTGSSLSYNNFAGQNLISIRMDKKPWKYRNFHPSKTGFDGPGKEADLFTAIDPSLIHLGQNSLNMIMANFKG